MIEWAVLNSRGAVFSKEIWHVQRNSMMKLYQRIRSNQLACITECPEASSGKL